MLEEAEACAMRFHSSLLMAFIALAGIALHVAAIFVTFGAAASRVVIAWELLNFVNGLGLARSSDVRVDVRVMQEEAKPCVMRCRSSLLVTFIAAADNASCAAAIFEVLGAAASLGAIVATSMD
mmetsp:Transcript_96441/g.249407  ORF Transcript_96441/g.249407 Transcript_96441/m.249407 type:complete len:124 (+) Transcript_96441:368-739(+)